MLKKSITIITSILLIKQSLFSIDKIQEINASISSVKVCLNSAIITHTHNVKIKPGKNKYAFIGVAGNIAPKSIQIRNIGSAELLTQKVIAINDSSQINLLPEEFYTLLGRSKDSLLSIEKNIETLHFELEALELEKNMLLKNDEIISSGKTISLAEFKLTSDYYRERYKEILMTLSLKRKELTNYYKSKSKILKAVFNKDAELENNLNYTIIVFELDNKQAEFATDIKLSYVAKGAGWIPVYEIYSTANKGLKINYRAKILNNTGINWNNIKITISTADPNEYYTAPDLEPFYLEYRSYKYKITNTNDNSKKDVKQENQEEEVFVPEREIAFQISKSYSFISGKVPTYIDVTNYDITTAEYLYRCAPRKEEQVYLIAKVKDWEKLNLMDGEATIYNNDIYLGKTYIKPSDIDEELELPLGVVDNVFIKHKLKNEYSSKKMLGNTIVSSLDYETKIKNNTSENIVVDIIDQVPVSQASNIKVEVLEFTEGADKDDGTGKILWRLDIPSNSEKSISLKYSVSIPKGYSVFNKYKKVQTRSKF